jgi:hypothetical protein
MFRRKTADLPQQLKGRHISTFRGYRIFINYQKPLYKSLHQSFFYSFITIWMLFTYANNAPNNLARFIY